MRILQLCPRFPYPKDDGGKIGMANIYESFHELGHELCLLTIVQDSPSESDIKSAKKFGDVHTYQLNTKNTRARGLINLIQRNSSYISKHKNKAILNSMISLAKEFKPDLVWADHSNMAWYAIHISREIKCKSALRLHNIEYTIWVRYAKNLEMNITKLFIELQANKLRKDEIEILNDIDIAFPITNIDLRKAKELSSHPAYHLMPAGVSQDLIDFTSSSDIEKEYQNSLVIATNYSWIHNVNGIEWFEENVLPLVKETIPDISISLVGRNIPDSLSQKEAIKSIGYVDDIKTELSKYPVYIAPLLVGGGVRIKILEAMALGLPVVATRISAEGIEATEKDGLFISDDENEQAKFISKLLSDEDYRLDASVSAKKYISDNHRWHGIVKNALSSITL